MPLWTPYAEENPLDLTKTSSKVKIEFDSPSTRDDLSPVYGSPSLQAEYSSLQAGNLSLQARYPAVYAGYSYPTADYTVPTAQMSPDSTSSGYNTLVPVAAPSSHFAVHPGALSPLETLMDANVLSDDPDFQAFEQDALRAMAEKNGGSLLGNNPRMRRAVLRSTNQDCGDDSYRKQRERNNFAAKQSRDRRKLREIHLALKVSYLKKEVASLKAKLAAQVCSRCQQLCVCANAHV